MFTEEDSLKRFHNAQQQNPACRYLTGYTYDTAYSEIQAGMKCGHWIWYVFPQLKTLGHSDKAIFYGIRDLNEACNYLRDPILFKNYHAMVILVQEKLIAGITLETLMGGTTDAQKLASSLTLFHAAASHLAPEAPQFKVLENHCQTLLDSISKQNYGSCTATAAALEPALKSTPEIIPDNSCELILVRELDGYIKQRDQEPSYWFQGLFKGFSKRDKLKAALSMRLQLNGSIDKHPELADIIKRNGFDMQQLLQRDIQQDHNILQQGRLGERLRKGLGWSLTEMWSRLEELLPKPKERHGKDDRRAVGESISGDWDVSVYFMR